MYGWNTRSIMFAFGFLILNTCLILCSGQKCSLPTFELPTWVLTNPAYQNPTKIESQASGRGSISFNESENMGWIVHVNDEAGYGIDISVEELHLGTENEDYLIVGGWPVSMCEFKTLKLFTGTFTRTRKLRILNAKTFFILFNGKQSKISPSLIIGYKRYGSPYASRLPSSPKPVVKDTAFEVYLKGRKTGDYSDKVFLNTMKEAIRAVAKAFCRSNDINFNDSIPTEDMVLFHKISFCPFEWPDQDVCAIIEHSIFVSGERSPNGLITMDYELTSKHLEHMWKTSDLFEIQELGIMVFKLPEAAAVVTLWLFGIGAIMISSLIMIPIFWKIERKLKKTKDTNSYEAATLRKKPRYKSKRLDQVPPLDLESNVMGNKGTNADLRVNDDENSSTEQPFKNYIGSILFFSNGAFNEDEEAEETAT